MSIERSMDPFVFAVAVIVDVDDDVDVDVDVTVTGWKAPMVADFDVVIDAKEETTTSNSSIAVVPLYVFMLLMVAITEE